MQTEFPIGWSMAERCNEGLTLAASQIAIDEREPTAGLLHHTNRGAHYTSSGYQSLLSTHGIRCTMS